MTTPATSGEARAEALILGAAFGFGVVAQGGFYRGQALVLLAGVCLAAAIAFARVGPRASDRNPATLGAVGLAIATVLSAVVNDYARGALESVLVLLGAVLVVLTVRRFNSEERELVRTAITVGGVIVAATAWAGTVFRIDRLALVAGGLWRGASTLTYANATGAFLVVAIVVTLRARARVERVALYVMTTGLVTTLSRGAAIAALVAVALLLFFTEGRAAVARNVSPAVLGVAAGAATVVGMPADKGSAPLAAIAVLLLAGCVLWVGVRPVVVVVGVVALGASALLIPRVREAADPVWHGRVGLSSEDRSDEWKESWRVFDESKLFGSGPGQLVLEYDTPDGRKMARYSHNEYLQVAAEAGGIAVGVMIAGLIGTLWAIRRTSPLIVAGLVALAASAFLDFIWHYPLLVMLGAMLVGLALSESERQDEFLGVGLGEAELR